MKTITIGLPKGFKIEVEKAVFTLECMVYLWGPNGLLERKRVPLSSHREYIKSMKRSARVYALMPIKEGYHEDYNRWTSERIPDRNG